ncbi:MAG TPA: glycosyl hydrolase family 79 C-terminal domain-containing protein [Solirubrobacteraceae bacterium]|nr:glycosyl hydrolase family 79 C-terminal domain-containing protein [Solirubrobacteraceae bacterium]
MNDRNVPRAGEVAGRRAAWLGLARVPGRVWLIGVIALAVGAVATALAVNQSSHAARGTGARHAAARAHATVTITGNASMLGVPASFLGFSTEYWALPLFEHHMARFARILTLERVPGDGPLVVRIGGDSTDHALFDVNVARLPKGLFELTPRWFRQARVLIAHVDARTLLDLNLVTDLPRNAAQWARAAEMQLPRGSILGYEIGNEPDLYNPRNFLPIFSPIMSELEIRLFPHSLAARTYVHLYLSYARALARYAPHAPLVAPVIAYPTRDLGWIKRLLRSPHPRLRMISAHMYPYSACARPGGRLYPTIPKILSEKATAGMARSLRPAIRVSHHAGLPFRLTELNSVTCGGVAGVSNTFSTALWAPDALFELVRAHVDGVNVHVRAFAINAAFSLTRRGLVARPLLYGLTLFTRTLGADPHLVRVDLRAKRSAHLKVWAVRVRGGLLHVLLINKGRHAVTAGLGLPSTGAASVERLLAPSAAATSGMTLDGQRLGPDDRWRGRAATERIVAGRNGYEVRVPRWSAALVTVSVAAGALPLP